MVEVSAENITLVTVVTFLSIFFILVASMPSGLTATPQQGKTVSVPSYFEAVDIQNFAQKYAVNLTDPLSESYDFVFGGWNMKIWDDAQEKAIWVYTYAAWSVFRWDFDYFHWYDFQGIERSVTGWQTAALTQVTYITYNALDDAYIRWVSQNNVTRDACKWTLKNDHTEMVAYVGFNSSRYSKPSEALFGGELSILFCMNFDKVNTTFNAWNLVGAILFFQTPNVHPVINAIIAIPIWIMIAWLIYILILKAIPFVGG